MSIDRFNHKVDRKVETKPARLQRIEVITGVERRRAWSREDKRPRLGRLPDDARRCTESARSFKGGARYGDPHARLRLSASSGGDRRHQRRGCRSRRRPAFDHWQGPCGAGVPDAASELKAALSEWFKYRPQDSAAPLFVSVSRASGDGRLTGDGLYKLIRKDIGGMAGVTARPHGLRHTAITEALNRVGGDFRTSSELFAALVARYNPRLR